MVKRNTGTSRESFAQYLKSRSPVTLGLPRYSLLLTPLLEIPLNDFWQTDSLFVELVLVLILVIGYYRSQQGH